jgi:hypothetical protein
MLSLFWVVVCVVAQPTNIAVHADAILLRKIRRDSLIPGDLVVLLVFVDKRRASLAASYLNWLS